MLIYIFAAALQERIITAIPLCSAFSCYILEVAFSKCLLKLGVSNGDVPQEISHVNVDHSC